MKAMSPLARLLTAGFAAALSLPAAEIPLETVQRDVFGARISEAKALANPVEGTQFQLRFNGFPGSDYELLRSSNLRDWDAIGTRTAAGGSAVFQEPLSGESPQFYQVMLRGSTDTTPPTWTANARMLAVILDSNGVDIDLHAAEDDQGVVGYALYQDGQFRATLAPDELSTFVDGLSPNTTYEFNVVACDRAGNCGQLPSTLRVRTRAPREPFLNPARVGSVFLNSGEFSIERTDLVVRGRELDFVFTRTYRSGLGFSGPLGHGWWGNCFERVLERRNGDVVWLQGSGRIDTFAKDPEGGGYRSPAGVFMDLSKEPEGFKLISSDGLTRLFGHKGRLTELTTANAVAGLIFSAAATGTVTAAKCDLGGMVSFDYDDNGRLTTITDFTGRKVRYTYDDAGNLVAVRSPVVLNTPNGNDYPEGKTERYLYDTENPDPDLAHNLVAIIGPNEVADGSLTSREIITYGDSGFDHDRVLTHTVGGINGSKIPAGGTYAFTTWTKPHNDGLLLQAVTVTDPRGNDAVYALDPAGRVTQRTRVLAGQDDAVTSFAYDPEGRLLRFTRPEGDAVTYAYDTMHASRRSQGNLLSVTRTPGPRGADQAQLLTRFTYEPVFNRLRSLTDPRGNTWNNRFDYEEGCDFAAIGAKVGWSAAKAQLLLHAAGMCEGEAPGDLNGDGDTGQVAGNVIRRDAPIVALNPASKQALLVGDATQEAVELFRYNRFGQLIAHRDAEHNLHRWSYYPETDPDHDGVIDNPEGDDTTGGYLAAVIRDDALDPARNSGANPPPASITTRFARNQRGVVTSVLNPRGVETRRVLNPLDQTVRILRAASVGNGNPDAEPLPMTAFGYIADLFYDANNNLVRREIEDRGNASDTDGSIETRFGYDILNQILAVTEEIDAETTRTVRCFYDVNGDSTLTPLDALNAVAREYDERGLPVAVTIGATKAPPGTLLLGDPTFDPRGGESSRSTYAWDGNGNLIAVTDASDTDNSPANNGPSGGDQTTCEYDGFDRLIRTIDPAGNVTALAYDANGNLVRARRFGPDGGPTPNSNEPSSNLLAETRLHHDERNRLTQVDRLLFANEQPDADIHEGAADLGKGNLVPDDGAVNTRYEYDAVGRLTFLVQDDGDVFRARYDGTGRVLSVTGPLGNAVEYAYDDCGNVIETRETDVATQDGSEDEVFLTTFFYDAEDRLVARVNNLGHTHRFGYDSRGNLIAASDANGPAAGQTFTRRAFPDAATTVNSINQHGNVRRFARDGLGRLIRTERVLTATGFGDGTWNPEPDPAQGGGDGLITTRTIFDGNDLVTARLDDNGFRTSYTYDNLNRRVEEIHGACTLPAIGGNRCDPATSVLFAYDTDHNLVRKTDEAGNVFDFTHDALNRLLQVDITPAPGVGGVTQQRFEYDGQGRLTSTFDDHSGATVTRRYDSLSRLLRESTELPGVGSFHTDSAWRAENLRSGLTYPNGAELSYTYDASDRVRLIGYNSFGNESDYAYIGARLLEERHPNGTRNLRRYDGAGRPVQVATLDADGNTVVGFGYTWDRGGNRLSETKTHDPANSEVYRYDSAYRLTQFTRPNPGSAAPLHSSWGFDGSGNWREVDGVTRNVTSFNEIADITPLVGPAIALTSDDNGNLTRDPSAATGAMSYEYDAFNRLISASGADGTALTYTYDPFGRRLSEDDGAAHHLAFLHDGNNMVVDWDVTGDEIGTPGTAGVLREFALAYCSSDAWSGNAPARYRDAGGNAFYYHRNSLGSTAALTPATGAGVERVRYEAYGSATVEQADGLAPTGNPYLFTGQRHDALTGNYYYRTRYYDAGLGRFLSRDPIGAWGDPANHGNAYALCNNNPINNTDPSGSFVKGKAGAFAGARAKAEGKAGIGPFGFRDGGGARAARFNHPGSYDTFNNEFHAFAIWDTGDQWYDSVAPVRTRSFWNFTTGEGEVAYQQVRLREAGYSLGLDGFGLLKPPSWAGGRHLAITAGSVWDDTDIVHVLGGGDSAYDPTHFPTGRRATAGYEGDVIYHEFGHYLGVVDHANYDTGTLGSWSVAARAGAVAGRWDDTDVVHVVANRTGPSPARFLQDCHASGHMAPRHSAASLVVESPQLGVLFSSSSRAVQAALCNNENITSWQLAARVLPAQGSGSYEQLLLNAAVGDGGTGAREAGLEAAYLALTDPW